MLVFEKFETGMCPKFSVVAKVWQFGSLTVGSSQNEGGLTLQTWGFQVALLLQSKLPTTCARISTELLTNRFAVLWLKQLHVTRVAITVLQL